MTIRAEIGLYVSSCVGGMVSGVVGIGLEVAVVVGRSGTIGSALPEMVMSAHALNSS